MKAWLRRVGIIGFAFFFLKGMLWLVVPFMIARGCTSPVAVGLTENAGRVWSAAS